MIMIEDAQLETRTACRQRSAFRSASSARLRSVMSMNPPIRGGWPGQGQDKLERRPIISAVTFLPLLGLSGFQYPAIVGRDLVRELGGTARRWFYRSSRLARRLR